MSRALSNGRAALECGNISLENILLAEMNAADQTGSVLEMVAKLDLSSSSLAELKENISRLRVDMRLHDYRDLSEILGIRPSNLASELFAAGLVSKPAWDVVAAVMDSKGFFGMLDEFDSRVATLGALTAELQQKAAALHGHEIKGELTAVLERNEPGNLKVEFARLYSTWNQFQEVFLASSILSTELWYRFSQTGSLLAEPELTRAVA